MDIEHLVGGDAEEWYGEGIDEVLVLRDDSRMVMFGECVSVLPFDIEGLVFEGLFEQFVEVTNVASVDLNL